MAEQRYQIIFFSEDHGKTGPARPPGAYSHRVQRQVGEEVHFGGHHPHLSGHSGPVRCGQPGVHQTLVGAAGSAAYLFFCRQVQQHSSDGGQRRVLFFSDSVCIHADLDDHL